MYDRASRFNPTPSSPLQSSPPHPSSNTDGNSSSPGPPSASSTSRPNHFEVATLPSRYISTTNRRTVKAHTAQYVAYQKRHRSNTWLPESQITRQMKRIMWKVQTREERLVVDLNVVRAAVREMIRAVEGAEVGTSHQRMSMSLGPAERERRTTERWGCGMFNDATEEPEDVLWRVADAKTKGRAFRCLESWWEFVEYEFENACDGVLVCRSHVDDEEAYKILAKAMAINPSATDKLWFEDLPSMGERAGLGGLKTLRPRAKAVVWAMAEVYQQFKREEIERLVGGRCETEAETRCWIDNLLTTGGSLRECYLIEGDDNKGKVEEDDGVLSLCDSLEHLSLDPEPRTVHRSKSQVIKDQIERIWQEAFGFVKNGCTGC